MRFLRAGVAVRVVVIGAIGVAAAGAAAVAYRLSRPGVTVSSVIEGPVVQAFYATGTVRPQTEYPINSSVNGIIQQVLVREGDTVAKDQLLAVVNDPQLQYQADKAKADLQTRLQFADPEKSPVLLEYDRRLKANEQMLEVAKSQEQRFEALAKTNAASANDRDQAFEHMEKIWADLESLKAQRSAKLRELQEDVEVAQAAQRAAMEDLRRQELRSPVAGVVLDEPLAQGTRVAVNGHLMQIADLRLSNLVLRAAVDEENIARARLGQQVKMTLYSFPDRVFEGKVDRKYPKADPTRRTFDVDVIFVDPDPRLQPGMTGELAFIEQTRDRALLVPAQAVQSNTVWSVSGSRLHKTDAQVGIRSIERAEVRSGLRVGDLVVISPIGTLSDGQSVRIEQTLSPSVAADLNKPTEQLFKGFQ